MKQKLFALFMAVTPFVGLLNGAQEKSISLFPTLFNKFVLPGFKEGNPEPSTINTEIIGSFGNKTFNLCVLEKLADVVNKEVLSGSRMSMLVPQFIGISHQELASYLEEKMPLKEIWGKFIKHQGMSRELAPEAVKLLGPIRFLIQKQFADVSTMPASIKQQLEQFIAQNKNSVLMIRSTGKEDRTDIANAGGNESLPSAANLADIWHAMGAVVVSYFSEKSLHQRLLADDKITEPFFIPVLIQRMVGEKAWTGTNPADVDVIPISGVMFTQESSGATPGVVEVQTAYGHNQGVVNSLVAVDTFYVGPSGIIHPILRKKAERFVSVMSKEGAVLERVGNPESLQQKPSLSAPLVSSLSRIADKIQKTYKHPMDIEFVVEHKRTGGTVINLVQARPLLEKKFEQKPNYLPDSFVAKVSLSSMVKGVSIGSAGGFVRTITNKDQLLIKDELPQALNDYHANQQRERVKVVLVGKMAPTTSHEATQFRSYGVPVIFITQENKARVERLFEQGSLVIDTQRAFVLQAPGTETELAAHAVEGWYSHPIPSTVSLGSLEFIFPKNANIRKTYQSHLKELTWVKEDKDSQTVSLRDLLTSIKKIPSSRTDLIGLLKQVLNRMQVLQKVERHFPEVRMVLSNAWLFAAEILYTFDLLSKTKMPQEQSRMVYLYPISFFDAVLFQQDDPEIVACHSYALWLKKLKQEGAASRSLGERSEKDLEALKKTTEQQIADYFVQFEKMTKLILSSDVSKRWQQFVSDLLKQTASSDEKVRKEWVQVVKQFATMAGELNEFGVLELWINTSFATEQIKEQDIQKLTQRLVKSVAENEDLMKWVRQTKNMISAWEHKVEDWGDPSQFTKLMSQFDKQFVTVCIRGESSDAQKLFGEVFYRGSTLAPLNYKALIEFATQYAPLTTKFVKATPLGKQMLLQLFEQVVTVYDKTIKGLTGSPAYKDKLIQVQNFAQLLVPYVALMEEVVVLVLDKEKDLMPLEGRGSIGFEKYMGDIRTVFIALSQKPDPENLKVSARFSVDAAQIGSKADIERPKPASLEDIYTLAHQNSLMVIATLTMDYGISKSRLPGLVQNLGSMLENIKMVSGQTTLIGINYQYPKLTLLYNLPLRAHSAGFEIAFNAERPDRAVLLCKILGFNEGYRMYFPMTYAYLASYASKLHFEMPPKSNTPDDLPGQYFFATTEFSWVITRETTLDEIRRYLSTILFRTMQQTFGATSRMGGVILRDINTVKPFLPSTLTEELEEAFEYGSYSMTLKRLTEFMQGLSNSIPDEFFARDMFLTAWFTKSYIDAKLYDQALKIIEITLSKIIREKRFAYCAYGARSPDYTLWADCLKKLTSLKGSAEKQTLATFLGLFSAPATIDALERKQKEEVLTLAQQLSVIFPESKRLAGVVGQLKKSIHSDVMSSIYD